MHGPCIVQSELECKFCTNHFREKISDVLKWGANWWYMCSSLCETGAVSYIHQQRAYTLHKVCAISIVSTPNHSFPSKEQGDTECLTPANWKEITIVQRNVLSWVLLQQMFYIAITWRQSQWSMCILQSPRLILSTHPSIFTNLSTWPFKAK